MRKWAVKKLDGSIYLISCNNSPGNFLTDPANDTVLNEITANNPMPDNEYRSVWKDNGSGDVTVSQANQDSTDRAKTLENIRTHRAPLLTEADILVNKKLDDNVSTTAEKAYRKSLRNITDSYKDGSGNPTSALDAIADVVSDIAWPTKP